ncbi:uncharacterized protein J4E84_004091 [Alternaria hordeiaustralica]|uniref:uncharacterized protein n=1 Tax=Alternaria hordeiaustralica TaxID=1187925 RepID=UPI0020C55E2C|nr:uncharacterized protein J4E84_004091 [Alternaria hordeiaustralica]KAI4689910.1 hypothetical protein J4E84_004091 [Alternaria hordeiaustralica]
MNGRQALLLVGQTVGGSSAINGQYFDRGSRHDYDAWTQIGGPEFANSTTKWDWESLFPYFKKHPVTARRSHAGLGHYSDVSGRPNYDLLVKHQVIRVVYTDGVSHGPPRVEIRSLSNDEVFNVTAKAEIIISAGAMHTPTILQRSGIGPAALLNDLNITAVLDLPGVGSNLQDHSSPGISWNCE